MNPKKNILGVATVHRNLKKKKFILYFSFFKSYAKMTLTCNV